ncbi:uncharacterized protein LOC119973234 isoform X2 [Scyliorhinus canicula]|uniref:uncharacterized protein LOC119973234 isoform X2 n=1 Tax=Scyliorhinus canicula TaxID=7830 RepID=UPI0018F734CA|nr:uncharacterized protein LOC119973234 isoform X2 [Scyliorhinus canicula]
MSLIADDLYFFDQASFRNFKKPRKQVPESTSSQLTSPGKGPQVVKPAPRRPKSKRLTSSIVAKQRKTITTELGERHGSSVVGLNVFISAYADEIEHMYYFEKLKNSASSLLTEINGMILHCKIAGIPFPRGLENILNYCWSDFVKEVAYSRKRWPTAACRYICETRRASLKSPKTIGSLSPQSIESDKIGSRSKSVTVSDELTEKVTVKIEQEPVSLTAANPASVSVISEGEHKKSQSHTAQHKTGVKLTGSSKNSAVNKSKSPEKTALSKVQRLPGFTINFAVSSKACLDQGWIIKPRDETIEKLNWEEVCIMVLDKIQSENARINFEKMNMMKFGFDKPVILLHYEEAKAEPTSKFRKFILVPEVPTLKDGKPHIPNLKVENPALSKMYYALTDGSGIIYYPSGNIAVCRSHSGLSCQGAFYTNIFNDSALQPVLLASFTPFGHGSVFLTGGDGIVLQFHEEGGVMIDEKETTMKKWQWPRRGKLAEPIWVKINEYITIRIVGQYSIYFTFKWHYEVIRFPLSPLPDVVPPKADEMGELQTQMAFTSSSAKLFVKVRGSKIKSREGLKKLSKPGSIPRKHSSVVKSEVSVESSQIYKEITIQSLQQLHKRIKTITNKWMEYYRSETGLSQYKQGKIFETEKRIKNVHLGTEQIDYRIPANRIISQPSDYIRFLSVQEKTKCLPQSCTFTSDLASIIAREGKINLLLARRGSFIHADVKQGFRFPRVQKEDKPWLHMHTPCPVALRNAMLGEDLKPCRCSTKKIPSITDLEFDTFIQRSRSDFQHIIVVCVVISQQQKLPAYEGMIQDFYEQNNRNRNQPCLESQRDSFRLLKYDISTANEYTAQSPALLVERHNATPGMFLMYIGGKLLFADHIFNGYSNTIKDLKKQIAMTYDDYLMGRHLLYDFRFSSLESELPSTAQGERSWKSLPEWSARPKSEASIQPGTCIVKSSNRAATIQEYIAFSLSQRNACCTKNINQAEFVSLETLVKGCAPKPD